MATTFSFRDRQVALPQAAVVADSSGTQLRPGKVSPCRSGYREMACGRFDQSDVCGRISRNTSGSSCGVVGLEWRVNAKEVGECGKCVVSAINETVIFHQQRPLTKNPTIFASFLRAGL